MTAVSVRGIVLFAAGVLLGWWLRHLAWRSARRARIAVDSVTRERNYALAVFLVVVGVGLMALAALLL